MFLKERSRENRSKKLTRADFINHIEQLSAGETLSYRLPVSSGGHVATVGFNTGYPWRGNKYLLSVQATADNRVVGTEEQVLASDEAKEIAAWLLQRRGKPFSIS